MLFRSVATATPLVRDLTRMTKMLTDLHYRMAVPEDHGWIARSVDAWWGRPVSNALPRLFLDHFHRTSFVSELGQRPVGFLIGFMSPSIPEAAYIHFVGVDPDHRRFGIARSLYALFFDLAKQNGRTIVKAITSPTNTDSITYHAMMGFSVSEPVDCYDRPDVPRVVFTKELP